MTRLHTDLTAEQLAAVEVYRDAMLRLREAGEVLSAARYNSRHDPLVAPLEAIEARAKRDVTVALQRLNELLLARATEPRGQP